jgi:hypothetical protein
VSDGFVRCHKRIAVPPKVDKDGDGEQRDGKKHTATPMHSSSVNMQTTDTTEMAMELLLILQLQVFLELLFQESMQTQESLVGQPMKMRNQQSLLQQHHQ